MILLETKTGSVRDEITIVQKQKKPRANINKNKKKKNVSRTCSFKFWREFNKQKVKF
jgi:hypothetical protein